MIIKMIVSDIQIVYDMDKEKPTCCFQLFRWRVIIPSRAVKNQLGSVFFQDTNLNFNKEYSKFKMFNHNGGANTNMARFPTGRGICAITPFIVFIII